MEFFIRNSTPQTLVIDVFSLGVTYFGKRDERIFIELE